MIKSSLYIAVVILIIQSCKINKPNYINYYQNISEAEYYFYSQNFDSAIIYYETAFKKIPKIYDVDRYNYIISLNNNNRSIEALKLIENQPILFEQADSNYFKNLNHSKIIELEKKSLYLDSIMFDSMQHISSYKAMKDIYDRDQKYRKKLSTSFKNNDSLGVLIYMDSMKIADSINQSKIIHLINTDGLSAGVNNPYSAYWSVIFLHLPYEFLDQNRELFFNEMIKGNLLPNYFYGCIDRDFHDKCNSKSLYLQYAREPIINDPKINFQNLSEKGLSPYYFSNRHYVWGTKPPKNSSYTYYSSNKKHFNCLNHKINLNFPKKIECK